MAEEGRQVATRVAPQLSIWSIGAGFEGSASDWTEYVVWLLGFISLMWWVWSRNIQALPDFDEVCEELRETLEKDEGDEDESFENEVAAALGKKDR
mmetsp:Transcript_113708/g.328338  ORF Transcript_113708/g.328338 Transcript_113708/m.328338 type:complete len:96 (-) Transcript_113708:18-305(-)